jgi:hypothetical protein
MASSVAALCSPLKHSRSCFFLVTFGSSIDSASPSVLILLPRTRSAGFWLDAGCAAMRLLRLMEPSDSRRRGLKVVALHSVSGPNAEGRS